MTCLDDGTLDDLAHGRLSGDVLALAEQHLDGCGECSAVVSVLAGGVASPTTDLERGAVVGRNLILEPLGRGAMGVVYLAYDPELDRKVALKLLRPGLATRARDRMQREAQSMARLSHPNVVGIYDVGRFGEDLYLAMEFVRGKTLRAWLAEGRAWRVAARVLAEAGDGLAAAHEAGLVHRDFKPDNVIVGDDGRVRVTDFGLARTSVHAGDEVIDRAEPLATPDLTHTGALLGTPVYMAPELLRGGEATPASDQFALAVTLHEALSGARPFAGGTVGELQAAMERGLSSPPRGLPARVWRLVSRGLAQKPEQRYPSVGALTAALRDASRDNRPKRALSVLALGMAATLGVVVIAARATRTADPCSAGVAVAAETWNKARAARVRQAFVATGAPHAVEAAAQVSGAIEGHVRRWAAAHRDACEATHVRHEQSEAMLDARMHCVRKDLDGVVALAIALEHVTAEGVVRVEDTIRALRDPDACADTTQLAALDPRPADPRLDALDRNLAAAAATAAGGDYRAALAAAGDLAREADAIGYRPAVGEAKLLLATLLRKTGAYADAAREARAALWMSEAAHDDLTAARAWLEILAASGEQGAWAEVLSGEGYARAAIARAGGPRDLEATALNESGVARTNTGDLDGAERDLDRALALRSSLSGERGVEIAQTLTALGNLKRLRGELPRALAFHREALERDIDILGPDHPSVARHHHNIAGILRTEGKFDEALVSYERALTIETHGLGPKHRAVGRTENSIGLLWLERGDPKRAREHLEVALAILDGHPDRALALQNLGAAAALEGKFAEAIGRFDAAIAIYTASLGEDSERVKSARAARAKSVAALAAQRQVSATGAPRPPLPGRPPPGTTAYAPQETLDTGK